MITRTPIDTLDKARTFVCWLLDNDLAWHFDDDPFDCLRDADLTRTEIGIVQGMADEAFFEHASRGECIFATMLDAGKARGKF